MTTTPDANLLGAVRRSPDGTRLAILWPSPPRPLAAVDRPHRPGPWLGSGSSDPPRPCRANRGAHRMSAQSFAELVTTHAIKAGYDLSSPRSGGKKQLAEDTGMSQTSVSRMLSGQTIPVAEVLESLAAAIDIPVGHLLEAAGIVSPGTLTATDPPAASPMTARQAAARLGITKPLAVEVFEAVTATLLAGEAAS